MKRPKKWQNRQVVVTALSIIITLGVFGVVYIILSIIQSIAEDLW